MGQEALAKLSETCKGNGGSERCWLIHHHLRLCIQAFLTAFRAEADKCNAFYVTEFNALMLVSNHAAQLHHTTGLWGPQTTCRDV